MYRYGTVGTCSGLADFVADEDITGTDPDECCLGTDCAAGNEFILDGVVGRRALTSERRLTLGGEAALAAGMESTLRTTTVTILIPWCDGTNSFPCLYGLLVTPRSLYLFICLNPTVVVVICITPYDMVIVFFGNVLKIGESMRCRRPFHDLTPLMRPIVLRSIEELAAKTYFSALGQSPSLSLSLALN